MCNITRFVYSFIPKLYIPLQMQQPVTLGCGTASAVKNKSLTTCKNWNVKYITKSNVDLAIATARTQEETKFFGQYLLFSPGFFFGRFAELA